jgi:1,5-anhydro-D-fructose reductase (1,5-anhydro-D-mannitol-forming)
MALGWGIIGLGRSADPIVGPAIAADPNSRLVAVVSRDADRANAFAARHNATMATTNHGAMLADPAVEVVGVTSPNAFHPEQPIAAAQAGKHVF